MHTFVEVFNWLTDGARWTGDKGIPALTLEHLELSFGAVGLAALVALPLGVLIGHRRRGEFAAITVANLGRAVPSFAILVLSFILFVQLFPKSKLVLGFLPTLVALFLLAIPPMFTNAVVGVRGVDEDTVEAARGMGMTERQVLTRLELRLAAPVIMAGVRISALQVIATATLSALIGGGTLGRFIIDGLATFDVVQSVAGAVLVAVLALLVDGLFALLERAVAPRVSSRAVAAGPGRAAAVEPLKAA
jgi:osmoprotectant transport system permease protein